MKEPRDGFILYRSVRDAVQCLSAEERLIAYDAIIDYALDFVEPALQGVPMAIFLLIKPQIDANQRRYENGKKGGAFGVLGGRPPKQTPEECPTQPHANPTEDPTQPHVRLDETPKEKVKEKEKEKEKDQVKEKEKGVGSANRPPAPSPAKNETKQPYAELVTLTPSQYEQLVAEVGVVGTTACIDLLNAYKGSSGKTYESDYHAIQKWAITAWKERAQPEQPSGQGGSSSREMASLEQLCSPLPNLRNP